MAEEKAGNIPTARAYFKRALERKGRSVPTLVALAQLEGTTQPHFQVSLR